MSPRKRGRKMYNMDDDNNRRNVIGGYTDDDYDDAMMEMSALGILPRELEEKSRSGNYNSRQMRMEFKNYVEDSNIDIYPYLRNKDLSLSERFDNNRY